MFPVTIFIYGFLAAAGALLLEGVGHALAPLLTSSIILIGLAAFIEEGSKWVLLRQLQIRSADLITVRSGFMVGFIFALGFFAVELGLILIDGRSSPLLPLLGIFLVHLFTCLFFAYYLVRTTPRTLFHTWALVLGMTVLHMAYNIVVLT